MGERIWKCHVASSSGGSESSPFLPSLVLADTDAVFALVDGRERISAACAWSSSNRAISTACRVERTTALRIRYSMSLPSTWLSVTACGFSLLAPGLRCSSRCVNSCAAIASSSSGVDRLSFASAAFTLASACSIARASSNSGSFGSMLASDRRAGGDLVAGVEADPHQLPGQRGRDDVPLADPRLAVLIDGLLDEAALDLRKVRLHRRRAEPVGDHAQQSRGQQEQEHSSIARLHASIIREGGGGVNRGCTVIFRTWCTVPASLRDADRVSERPVYCIPRRAN